MPPKGSGRRREPINQSKTPQRLYDSVSAGENGAKSGDKVKGKAAASPLTDRRGGRARATRQTKALTAVPDVFQDLLAETLPNSATGESERPRKRRRVGRPEDKLPGSPAQKIADIHDSHSEDDASMDFEDVLPKKQAQTTYDDSGDSSAESDAAWEEIEATNYSLKPSNIDRDDGDLDLTLAAENSTLRKPSVVRRRAVTKVERAIRLTIHKMHILCLLSHTDRRNNWCNDNQVQSSLKHLISKQMLDCLKPKQSYTQFGKAESVKKGLNLALKMWNSNFRITAKGMQRSYWAESEAEIKNFKLPPDADRLHEKREFRAAAKELQGSRDVGAQLFCALLRGAGLDVRLICSLQPLPLVVNARASAPNGLRESQVVAKEPTLKGQEEEEEGVKLQSELSPFSRNGPSDLGTPFSARRRLGHPNAADYFMPSISTSPRPTPRPKQKRIRESPYPVFWVEVLDEAHQKWMPVNTLDPTSVGNPRKFEPPATDPENILSCVIAFEDDGAARDVTQRYAKSFSSKTRKNRVESTEGGERWWRKVMRIYSRGYKSDLDQIEDTELAAAEAREPMPKSVDDFKNHPVYALERHLRRNEVLLNPREVGRVALGRGGKTSERVYRRVDVKTAKSADGWYRIGREVKVGEQPLKVVAARTRDGDREEGEANAGTALYTESQTELYEAPPIVSGRVPKNSYGNLDIYVPSMVPQGGVHIPHLEASHAARLLAIDYADAVTGFKFQGRHGTAVIKGIVAAIEFKDAIEAVLEGFADEQARAEEEMRSLAALKMWKRFMVGLRIKERVDGYEVEGERGDGEEEIHDNNSPVVEEDSGMESKEYVDDSGGGFFPEDDGGGGFFPL